MFIPLLVRAATAPRLCRAEALGLVVLGAATQYLVQYAYAPGRFVFPDELSHVQTATQIMRTHHLFAPNYLLPVSPQYPGLELVTTAVASLGHASVYASGVAVVGAAHMLAAFAIFGLFWAASGSWRVAALGGLIYETNPHYQFFDSYFIYQNLAVPLFVVALLAVSCNAGALADRLRGGLLKTRSERIGVWLLGLLAGVSVVVSHHVTTFALVAFLALLACFHWLTRHKLRSWQPRPPVGSRWVVGAAALLLLLAILWIALLATQTLRYLSPTANDIARSATGLLAGSSRSAAGASAPTPRVDQLVTYALTLIILIALPWGWWATLRARRSPLALFLAALSTAYYILIVLRLVSSDGAELAGRSFTFVYIPVAFTLAMAATRPGRLPKPLAAGLVATGAGVLFIGGLASGWPPYWERLPGNYQVSGLERSLSPPDYAVARWFGSHLAPGQRVAVDLADYALVGSIGEQDVVRNAGPLFYSATYDSQDRAFVRRASIRYVVIDRRLATALPASGRYFPDDPEAYSHRSPIPLAALEKFNHVPGASRVYDNGPIAVFDLAGAS